MASFTKNDPSCSSAQRIVFVGNIRRVSYIETDPRYQSPNPDATAELLIDILASPGYERVQFREITLVLEILEPTGVRFVEHSARNNFKWGIPEPSRPGQWLEASPGTPTTRLRIRWEANNLLSGPGNGLSHRLGIGGLAATTPLRFTAEASASEVKAVAASCGITIAELLPGESLPGYLG